MTSRTSVMRYKGTTKLLKDIARELGVDAVVEARCSARGTRPHYRPLIRASTDTHLWANDYDRDAGDFLQMQSDVVEPSLARLRFRSHLRKGRGSPAPGGSGRRRKKRICGSTTTGRAAKSR